MPLNEDLSTLATQPAGPGGPGGPGELASPGPGPGGGPDMPPGPMPDPGPVTATPQSAGHGGPGIDTPVEKQAMELLTRGAELIRKAADVDPAIRPIIDKHLENAFLDVMTTYGLGEQAKLSLKQAKMQRDQQVAGRLNMAGPPVPPTGG